MMVNGLGDKKGYLLVNSQILAQHDGDISASRYFYLHDRLGSTRDIINTRGSVVNCTKVE